MTYLGRQGFFFFKNCCRIPKKNLGSELTKIEGFQPKKLLGDPPFPPLYERKRGVFSKVVQGFQKFGYDFWVVGGDVWRWLCRYVRWKISAHVDGGLVEGLACADPGARTPIGVTLIFHWGFQWHLLNTIYTSIYVLLCDFAKLSPKLIWHWSKLSACTALVVLFLSQRVDVLSNKEQNYNVMNQNVVHLGHSRNKSTIAEFRKKSLFGTKICVLLKIATKLYIFKGCSAIYFPVSHHLIISFLQCHIFTIGSLNILTVPYIDHWATTAVPYNATLWSIWNNWKYINHLKN